ncbi:maleylpyruvate isomerase family mycothiol-dependent enzyme [Actinomadura sp. 9N407]|uniref:maleylpyruvate isomerase family mycothiol-dependent enzyme n=1 Tax=Actinomadura sp. 9N407 TaxID=3375154 RepID=UPI00378A8022
MDNDKILAWTKAERLSFADLLEDLDEHEWRVDSLCSGWTVRDVAAHLTMSTRDTLPGMIKGIVRARGDWNRMMADQARKRAAEFEPADLIAQIRETAGSAKRAPFAAALDPLVDALVHGQDIARPLGRAREMPPEPTIAAIEHVRASAFYGARKRLKGITLVATDLDWSAGEGPDEIRGTTADLLLLASGRTTGLSSLSGPGTERMALS